MSAAKRSGSSILKGPIELRKNQQNAEAIAEYPFYVARKPEDPLSYLGAGQNALEMDDFAEATHLVDQSLTLAAHDPIALAACGALEGAGETSQRRSNTSIRRRKPTPLTTTIDISGC
jgi:hypothetical protein